MVKNKKHQNRRKTSSVKYLVFAVFLLAFIAGFFVASRLFFRRGDAVISGEQVNESNLGESKYESGDNIDRPEDFTEENKTPVKYDGENPNASEGLTGFVTYTGIIKNNATIRVNIDQFLDLGTCDLYLGDYSFSSNIVASASTSSCDGFDIPLSELSGLSGNVNFEIKLTSGEKYGTIEGSIEL